MKTNVLTSPNELTENVIYTIEDAVHGSFTGTFKGMNYDSEIRENVLYFWTENDSIPVDASDFIQAIEVW